MDDGSYFCGLFWSISLSYAHLCYPPHLRLAAHQNSAIETYHEKNSFTPSNKKLEYHIHFGLALNIVALKNIPLLVGCSWTAVHELLIYYNLPQYKTTGGTWCSVVVKGTALQVGRSQDRFLVSPGFFPWHLTVPCAMGSTQPLKMSTTLILGVKAAGA
jgi:hypothetical protein